MKISIKQVLSEAGSFYRKNFKRLIGAILIFVVSTAFMKILELAHMLKDYDILLAITSVVFILIIIFMPRFYMAVMIFIHSLLSEKKITLREAYDQTKGKYWILVSRLSLVILFGTPIMMMITYVKEPYASVVRPIYLAFIILLFFTLVPMIAIAPKTNDYLIKSIQLIKRNYVSIFILTMLTITLLAILSGIAIQMFQDKPMELLISAIIYSIICSFVYPFVSTVMVIVYRQLTEGGLPPNKNV